MLRALLTIVFFTASVLMHPAVASGDEDLDDPNLRVAEGRVLAVDRSGSSITVNAGIPMVFPVSRDTKLRSEATMYPVDIKISDIGVGDNVTVEFLRKGEDSRVPARVIRITVENKSGGNN